jgi:3-isopropylmalate/(R)-2-methylmalate dehydratase small subunit
MNKFTKLTSRVVPLPVNDVDTDQIIPARYLKVTDKTGLGDAAFADWRYLEGGAPNPSFVLNDPAVEGAQILLAGDNFGCGSSREHAPWALTGYGFRAVVSTSFADIFRGNSLKNGLVPVIVDRATHAALFEMREKDPALTLTVDLERQALVLPDGGEVTFPIDAFSKHCLLHGVDELGYLLSLGEKIGEYEASRA